MSRYLMQINTYRLSADCALESKNHLAESNQSKLFYYRSYLNLKELDAAQNFPPDHQSPGDCNGVPPKIPPAISVRSTGSAKSSRTAHYTPV